MEEDYEEEEEHFLPNRIPQEASSSSSPTTTTAVFSSNRNRVVHSPIEGSPFRFSGLKSRSVAAELSSINGAGDLSSPPHLLSPDHDDDMDRRLRSLPARRKQSTKPSASVFNNSNKDIRRTTVGVMPSARGSVTTLVSRNNRFSLPPVSTATAYDLQQHPPPSTASSSSVNATATVDPRTKLQAILRTISSTEWSVKHCLVTIIITTTFILLLHCINEHPIIIDLLLIGRTK